MLKEHHNNFIQSNPEPSNSTFNA